MRNIEYPVTLSKIDVFGRRNENISVNVFAFEENDITPMKITKHHQRNHHVNLLLLTDHSTSHYCLIKDLNKFLHRIRKKDKHKKFFCTYCLHGFYTQTLLTSHIPYCSVHAPQKVVLPQEGKDDMLEFSDFEKQMKVPFVIYADFETINVKMYNPETNPQEGNTTQTALLQPISFAYIVCCQNPKYSKPVT